MDSECELVPIIVAEDEVYGNEYSDCEFYCETCGEYVEGPCEE